MYIYNMLNMNAYIYIYTQRNIVSIRKLDMQKSTLLGNFYCKSTTRPADIYLFKFSKRNTSKRCEILLKLTIKTPENVIVVVLVFLQLILNIFHTIFSVSIVDFEQVKDYWENNRTTSKDVAFFLLLTAIYRQCSNFKGNCR